MENLGGPEILLWIGGSSMFPVSVLLLIGRSSGGLAFFLAEQHSFLLIHVWVTRGNWFLGGSEQA